MKLRPYSEWEKEIVRIGLAAVIRAMRAEALYYAAALCRKGGRTEDIENAEAIEAEAKRVEGK